MCVPKELDSSPAVRRALKVLLLLSDGTLCYIIGFISLLKHSSTTIRASSSPNQLVPVNVDAAA
jgi:hypothetical protein